MALLIPKDKRNKENKLDLNEGTILCLLDRISNIQVMAIAVYFSIGLHDASSSVGLLPGQHLLSFPGWCWVG